MAQAPRDQTMKAAAAATAGQEVGGPGRRARKPAVGAGLELGASLAKALRNLDTASAGSQSTRQVRELLRREIGKITDLSDWQEAAVTEALLRKKFRAALHSAALKYLQSLVKVPPKAEDVRGQTFIQEFKGRQLGVAEAGEQLRKVGLLPEKPVSPALPNESSCPSF